MYTFNVKYLGEDIVLSWNNVEEFKKFARVQLGRYYFPPEMSDDEFFQAFRQRILLNWRRISFNIDLQNIHRVVDVGSGIAVMDLMISQFNKNTEFYLVEKSEFGAKPTGQYFEEDHPGYHSWRVVEDCISTTGLDRNRFTFLSPSDSWPSDVDLLLSTYSWCWHYPKDKYWQRAKDSLKVGGKLALDILFRPDRDIVNEISDEFDSEPVIIPVRIPNSPFKEQFTLASDGSCGGFHIWTRNK